MVAPKRRIDVMLSSTFRDLEQHRAAVIAAMNGLRLTPLAQEFDAALHDSDLIKASFDKIDEADVYVGLIGSRYGQRPECAVRNPDRLSLSELEYRRAVERSLPRLMFIMADDHPLTLADLKLSGDEGDEGRRLLQAFIERVRKDRIAIEFSSHDDLKAKAITSFVALQRSLEEADPRTISPTQEPPPSPDDFLPPAPPAFSYVRKPYVEKQGFAGRVAELMLIDKWATGADAMLLFQGIGGIGKSMLVWHWLRTRATTVRADWAGRLWYSFYEPGADLNDFCVHALAYIRHEAPKTFRGRRTLDLGDELRRELDARPWLLVLDGLERILVAYNRAGKEHMADDDAVAARVGMGLDREPRDCVRPEDDDVLAMLAQAERGKLLTSSRLTPSALINAARQPIPGVANVALDGLAPEDAELVLRKAGVRGDGRRMRRFLGDNFAGHPLSVGIVAGQVMTFPEARGDFDRWIKHPQGGADPALIARDLRGRQNHILSRAFDNLSDDEMILLGSIAATSIELTPDVLRILNPKCPLEPKPVNRPRDGGDDWQQATYDAYLITHAAWEQKAREADVWLVAALRGLEARGLLRYDADTGSLDMHPAVRHATPRHPSLKTERTARSRQPNVFLSAGDSDGDIVAQVVAALLDTGATTWLDLWKLAPADPIRKRIGRSVQSGDFFLVFLSRASVESQWIQNEFGASLAREMRDRGISIIPVLVEDCDIPPSLASGTSVDLTEDSVASVQQLAKQLAAASAIDLSQLEPEKFEQLVRELLPPLGFAVRGNGGDHDQGFDFLATRTAQDSSGAQRTDKWVVIVKLYHQQRVGITAIRELIDLLAAAPSDTNGLLVTDSHLTSVARNFLSEEMQKAKREVRVIDEVELITLLLYRPDLVADYFAQSGQS